MKFKGLSIILLIIILGVSGYFYYNYYVKTSIPAGRLQVLTYPEKGIKIYGDKQNKYSFKYPEEYIVIMRDEVGTIISKTLNEELQKLKSENTSYQELPIPTITFETINELPQKSVPEMSDLQKIEIKNLEVYTGSVNPGIFEDKNYFIKLNDGTFLKITINPFYTNTNKAFNNASKEYNEVAQKIITNLELK